MATFRFRGELADFLPPARRGGPVSPAVGGTPSVKDVIERLGVPHTEVGRIEVDGAAVGFAHRIAGGERVDVSPRVPGGERGPAELLLRPPLPDAPAFLADANLGTLARYLRLLGFDTAYDTRWDDPELARRAVAESRVLLTRDRRLLMRRIVEHGLFVRHDDPEEQLVDVARRLRLARAARPFTRCMACNGALADVAKADIADLLEPGTRRTYAEFRRCTGCGRLYWPGAHHARLTGLVRRAVAAG